MKYRILREPNGKFSVQHKSWWEQTWYYYQDGKQRVAYFERPEDAEEEIQKRREKAVIVKEFDL